METHAGTHISDEFRALAHTSVTAARVTLLVQSDSCCQSWLEFRLQEHCYRFLGAALSSRHLCITTTPVCMRDN